jgi:obg-like ATPase 1
MQLLTAKPVIYLVNVSQEDYIRKKNKWCVHRRWPLPVPVPVPVRAAGPEVAGAAWLRARRLGKIKQWIDDREVYEGSVPLIPFSCDLESRLSLLPSNADREALLKELGTSSVLPKIVVTGYKALQLIYFFTAGEDEVRAWTIRVRVRPAWHPHVPLALYRLLRAVVGWCGSWGPRPHRRPA